MVAVATTGGSFMKLTKRLLAMVMTVVIVMGGVQAVFAAELNPMTTTVYIDGQPTNLGDSMYELRGWHFVNANGFAETFGFPLSVNPVSTDPGSIFGIPDAGDITRVYISFLLADSRRGDVYTSTFRAAEIEQMENWTLELGFQFFLGSNEGWYQSWMGGNLPAHFGGGSVWADEPGGDDGGFTFTSTTIMADIFIDYGEINLPAHMNIDDITVYGQSGFPNLAFPSNMTIDGDWYIPLEVATMLLGYDISIENDTIRIYTANSSLGIRPRVGTATPTQATPPTVTPTLTEQPSAWAIEQVTAAISAGLVPQNLQSQFTQPTTRAEFAALAVALYENVTGRVITERMEFNDTNDINVQKMGGLGVVTGVGGGNFNPNGELTREQAAVMLSRLAAAIGRPLPQFAPTFADNAQISSWAVDAVGQIQAAGIMGGTGNNMFSPSGDYTREQSIVTIVRLLEIVN